MCRPFTLCKVGLSAPHLLRQRLTALATNLPSLTNHRPGRALVAWTSRLSVAGDVMLGVAWGVVSGYDDRNADIQSYDLTKAFTLVKS